MVYFDIEGDTIVEHAIIHEWDAVERTSA